MQSGNVPTKFKIKFNRERCEVSNSLIQAHQDETQIEPNDLSNGGQSQSESQNVINVSLSDSSTDDENASQKQLVIYDPSINGGEAIDPVSSHPFRQKLLPSVGTFTVQCAKCFQWRLIPNQKKYEEIREHITEQPFVCETARQWRPEVSCLDEGDIKQDGSRLWAIDKPDIAKTPHGWERLLRIRGEGSTKFADVYYQSPSGKKLRSIPDVEKYLLQHPEYMEQGVNIAQFSFQIPRPLQENYVRKRAAKTPPLNDGNYTLEPAQVEPIAWASPNEKTDLDLPEFSAPYLNTSELDPVNRASKKARTGPSKRRCNFDFVYEQHQL